MQKIIKKKLNKKIILNLFTILFLIVLPYYLFSGKLYIGGDDTRLFYSYPFDFLKNVTYFSWYNVSTVGINVSNQYLLPFLSIWSILDLLIDNKVVLSYLAFSSPLIFGYLYFMKFVRELFTLNKSHEFELFIGSLFYILSPIIIFDQLFIFLTSVWLLGVVPAVGYYYLKYLETSRFIYLYLAMIICFIFSFTLLAIPWVFGLLLPLFLGSVILVWLSNKSEIVIFLKRSTLFLVGIMFTQFFWLFGFIAPYLVKDENSFAQKFLSGGFLDTFVPTVNATATGFIIYPLLNLFHRQIAFDFDWKLKSEFINLYDKTFFLNFIFIIVIAIGAVSFKKYLTKQNRKLYLFVFASFLLSLYFFTVNIGPLKDIFLLFGNIPGFVMFRNFYDKFAPGYVFLYAVLFTISLVMVRKKYPKKYLLVFGILIVIILLNFTTVKSTVNSPLWTTNNIHKTLNIPIEYSNFMNTIKRRISSSNTILSVPFGTASYTVIKDEDSDNVYVGTSPVKVFSGVNDISGLLSFNFNKEADVINKTIIDRKYKELNQILYKHNINYVFVTKNIPDQVLKSYIFGKDTLEKQDAQFLNAIIGEKLLSSEKGNYVIYSTKKRNSLLQSENLYFKKINAVKYMLYIKNIRDVQKLNFNDSFQADWKLFLGKKPDLAFCKKILDSDTNNTKECKEEFSFFNPSEMKYLWSTPIFNNTHATTDGTDNTWLIDPRVVRGNYNKNYYTVNKDGSINIEMVLYFKPQLYLYYGLVISIITLVLSTGYVLFTTFKKNEK